VRRRSGRAMGGGWNASDELLTVLDMQITGGILWVGGYLPSKKTGVKVGSALGVWRAQIGPTERAGDLGDSDSRIFVCLPRAKVAPVGS